MMSIGEFSALTGLSIDTLRHYHEVGVLVPASIDPITSYRRYTVDQVPRARRIAELRQVDLPLPTIRSVLDHGDGPATAELLDHRRVLAARARAANALVELVDLLIDKEMHVTDLDDDLRRQLLARFADQQRLGQALFDETRAARPDRYLFELPDDERPRGYAALAAQSRADAAWLDDVIERRGWPTRSMVGDDGAAAAWAIAQHADDDNERCQRWLPLLREAVSAGEALPAHYAALCDRVLLRSHSPQRFGTVVEPTASGWRPREPLEHPGQLDERRAGLGLGPIGELLASLPSPDAWYEGAPSS